MIFYLYVVDIIEIVDGRIDIVLVVEEDFVFFGKFYWVWGKL